ncbi:MAG: hypothetical protein HGA71_04340 [Azonexaceae bacterium]|nr:hypothetical protein [Azonexaceae bacterium]
MGHKIASIFALSAALAPTIASAIGFGEMSLQSRIGEPLMAEVPILTSSNEPPLNACFSLLALRGSELPVVTAGKPRLIRRGQAYILQIIGTRSISDPIFTIGLRAGCGYDVERAYVLMPEAPMALPQSAIATDAFPSANKPRRYAEMAAREGETLEGIADAQEPATPAERQRLLAALKRANPSLDADIPLPEGTTVRIPARPRSTPPRQKAANTAETQVSDREPPSAKPPAQPRKPKPAPAIALPSGADRLVLGSATEVPPPSSKGNSGLTTIAETEERLLKLETTLHQLTREMEKMDEALNLATKAIEVQNRIQLSQALNTPTTVAAVSTTAMASNIPTPTNWLELLLSAGVGAGFSFGMAHYLGQRRRPNEARAPLGFASDRAAASQNGGGQATPLPDEAPTPQLAPQDAAPQLPETSDFPVPTLPDSDVSQLSEAEVTEGNMEDEDSVLELAEIMLAFGRLRGAAETLAEHIDETLPKSIEPWSMLLDLYRRGGMREEFEALAAKMRSHFNAGIPAWNDSTTPISGLKTLEDFPHVIHKAARLWGTQESVDYLFSLVHDIRTGQRNGFPLEVVEEIALLMRILVDAYGLKRPS